MTREEILEAENKQLKEELFNEIREKAVLEIRMIETTQLIQKILKEINENV